MSLNFDELRGKAVDVAQTAAQKTRELAAIAKAKLSILTEEDKIRKAQLELGKLYYRDYVLGEEMDNAEYLPWCDKISASKAAIEDLKDQIEDLRCGAEDSSNAADCADQTETEAPAEKTE